MPASFSLPSNALQVFNSLVFSSSGNVAVRPHGIMTACKEEKTWSTSLPETVIIYKFTIFHWLRARLDRHCVELHYGTVLTHLPARGAVHRPFSHSQTSRYPPADCGNWLVIKKLFCLLANHGAPFSETFAFYFLLFLLSFLVVALPLLKLHRSQPIKFKKCFRVYH